MSAGTPEIPVAVRMLRGLYGASLFALPVTVRRRLSEPMLGTFDAACAQAYRRRGLLGSLRRATEEIGDVLVAAARQRFGRDPLTGRGRSPLGDRFRPLADLGTDLRSALRALAQRPAFAAIGILTLAAGIAAGTAVFSVVDSVVLRPLPYAQAETLVRLMRVTESGGFVSSWDARQLEPWTDSDVLAGVSAYRLTSETLVGGQEAERVQIGYVMPNALEFLGVRPLFGRSFVPEDGAPGAEEVAILEHSFARRVFGLAESAPGRHLELLGSRYRVIGVTPPAFRYPYPQTVAWVPRSLEALAAIGSVNAHARTPAGMRQETVQERADALATSRADGELVPLKLWPAGHVNTRLRGWVLVMFGAAGLLVLIACANTANLILAQATRREREISVRSALGAHRWRLVRQSLLESLTLAGAAGAVGTIIAAGLLPWLLRQAPRDITGYTANTVDLDGRALAFAMLLSLLTTAVFGLLPAVRGTRVDVARALTGSRGTEAAAGGGRLRGAIVVSEVALTLVLLLGAGLLLASFASLLAVDMGLDLEPVVTVDLVVPEAIYPTLEAELELLDGLVERLRAVDGVEDAAYGLGVPPGVGYLQFGPVLETEDGPAGGIPEDLILPWANVSPGYFDALGIRVLQGRGLEAGDRDDAAILGASMATALWPDGPAIGRRFRLGPDEPWLTVVGVVADVKTNGPVEPFGPMEMYRPFTGTHPHAMMTLVARAAGDPAALAPILRDLIRSADPNMPIERILTGEERLADSLLEPRFQLTLVGTFALLAALLAGFGIFGVVSYAVSQRTGEMGVRMALGASPRSVARLVVGSALRLTAAGVALGVGLGWMLGRLLDSILFRIEPTNPAVLAAVCGAVLAIALAACLFPALRAARVDPARSLRAE